MPPTRLPARQNGQGRAPAMPPIPFTAAAHEHSEPVITDATLAIGAAQQPRGPYDVPAFGFLRHVFMEVILSGGTIGAGVLSPDYPFNILQNITLSDVNGAPIFGPLDGYAALWANIVGGYAFRQDPRLGPWYVGTINGSFWLRIPVEISRHNGYGALANQNAAASYKLSWTLATSARRRTARRPQPPLASRCAHGWRHGHNPTQLTSRGAHNSGNPSLTELLSSGPRSPSQVSRWATKPSSCHVSETSSVTSSSSAGMPPARGQMGSCPTPSSSCGMRAS